MSTPHAADPFAALGLPTRPGLGDDEVRAAWRRIAAATHPDRAVGGDPARFAAAASAYTTLRTQFGRGEALADLTGSRGRAAVQSRAARCSSIPTRKRRFSAGITANSSKSNASRRQAGARR